MSKEDGYVWEIETLEMVIDNMKNGVTDTEFMVEWLLEVVNSIDGEDE
tara:strand:- start:435 stop:578 length:144 start_codon:yes stop_codon:yes gene_type:complete